MKTLKELMNAATPLPWQHKPVREALARQDTRPEPDAALITHCVNTYAELVAALERAIGIIEDLAYPANYPVAELRAVLKKAQNVKEAA